jgi:CDP-4-dehydro-6-deoxyglucose reductase
MPHQVTLTPSGQSFTVPDGETILQAAIDAGFHLPYGCRNGACGSCRGKRLEGQIDYGKYSEHALSQQERDAGYALFCVAKPLTDLVVESRAVSAVKDIVVRKLPCRVHRVEKVIDDVAIVWLKLPANERLQFLPGQYIEFILKDGSRRSFSMANAPHDDEFLQVHVRHVPGGSFTEHVFTTMKERDILRFEGPLGNFFLREDGDKPIVLVASGTGFAPIKAILDAAFKKGLTRPMALYWGGRRPHDLYMNELPLKWANEQPHFRYVPVVSDARPEDAWTGRTGFVHRAVLEDFADLSGHQVYACGAPIVVESARRDFTAQRGLPLDEFFADSFTTAADLATPAAG